MRTGRRDGQEPEGQERRPQAGGSEGSGSSLEKRPQAMIEIILYCPRYPKNTGNVGRLCAFTGCRLHLIHPLGFKITDKNLRRAGMDYWKSLEVVEHDDWESFVSSDDRPSNIHLFTTHAEKTYWGSFLSQRRRSVVWQRGPWSPERSPRVGGLEQTKNPQAQGRASLS